MESGKWEWKQSKTGYLGGYCRDGPAGSGRDICSLMPKSRFDMDVGCGSTVVPICQFCEVASWDGTPRTFVTLERGVKWNIPLEHTDADAVSARAKARSLPAIEAAGVALNPEHPHYGICQAYLRCSLVDEADALFDEACSGSRQAGAGRGPRWIDGCTGADTGGDPVPPGGGNAGITLVGLQRARDAMAECGYDSGGIVCYTTRRALAGLENECASSGQQGSFSRIVDGAALVDNMLVVSNSSRGLQATDRNGGASRSVVFARSASFGLVSDDIVAVSVQARPGPARISATHSAGGAIKNADSICIVSHS